MHTCVGIILEYMFLVKIDDTFPNSFPVYETSQVGVRPSEPLKPPVLVCSLALYSLVWYRQAELLIVHRFILSYIEYAISQNSFSPQVLRISPLPIFIILCNLAGNRVCRRCSISGRTHHSHSFSALGSVEVLWNNL